MHAIGKEEKRASWVKQADILQKIGCVQGCL